MLGHRASWDLLASRNAQSQTRHSNESSAADAPRALHDTTVRLRPKSVRNSEQDEAGRRGIPAVRITYTGTSDEENRDVAMSRLRESSALAFIALPATRQLHPVYVESSRCSSLSASSLSGRPVRSRNGRPKLRITRFQSLIPRCALEPNVVEKREDFPDIPDDLAVWLYEVDAKGQEVNVDGEYVSDELEKRCREDAYTDVVFMSHGWATRKKGTRVAFNQNMTRALAGTRKKLDLGDPGQKILYVGLHWPSHPTTAFTAAKRKAKEQDFAKLDYKELVEENKKLRDEKPTEYWSRAQEELAETDPDAASKLKDLVRSMERADDKSDIAKMPENVDDMNEVPADVKEDLLQLGEKLSPQASGVGGSEADSEPNVATREIMLDKRKPLSFDGPLGIINPILRMVNDGAITLKPLKELLQSVLLLVGISIPGRVLIGLRVVTRVIERIFFGQFERRAAVVGSQGVHFLLEKLMNASEEHNTRFHLVGHSLGGHVCSAAALGGPGSHSLPRKIHSLALLQGALPGKSYARGGSYRPLASLLVPIAGSVVASTSQKDFALENYEMFHAKSLGRHGFLNLEPDKQTTLSIKKGKFGGLGLTKGKFHRLIADEVINETTNHLLIDVDGAHGDLFDEELMAAVIEGMDLRLDNSDYVTTPQESLPPGYWGVDPTVRREN